MNRKILIAVIILIIVILLGIAGYFWFSKKAAPATLPVITFPGTSGTRTSGDTEGAGAPTEQPVFTPGSNTPLPRLYELHKLPVAGVGSVKTENATSARYIERGLGHIYETPLATLVESRIVNETRSGIMEALWGNGGKSVVVRFVDEKEGPAIIKTSVLNIGDPSTLFARSATTTPASDFTKTEEVFLPDYIPFMATAEDGGDKLFYIESGIGFSAGSLATFKNIGVSAIFSSAFTEWLPQFPNMGLVTLTTKPSAKVAGHLFFIDPKTKSVTKVLGGINGLTTLTSRDGKFVLFSEIKNGVPELSAYDVAKKTTRSLLTQTLPEKCVWSFRDTVSAYCAVPQTVPEAMYPDQWYQGLVTFSDTLWKIDTTTGLTQKIMTPSELGAPSLDMTNLALSSDGAYLLFMSKATGTPWVYRINEVSAPASASSTAPTKDTSATKATKEIILPRANPAPSVITSDMKQVK
ncbi:MAG: hypothetical protein HZB12_02455 [Candidatus Yonathbacteria bacterium]|nr:hypothetical protein [Candidatus Yonathbacteria bacterium]